MMSLSAYMTGFFMNFELLPILTDYIEQFWPFEEISIFSNSGHFEWRAGLSDTILKGTHPGTIPARFGLIWFTGFRGEDLNVIFYQNMPNLNNRYNRNFFKWPKLLYFKPECAQI
jgi:hypothetical protein